MTRNNYHKPRPFTRRHPSLMHLSQLSLQSVSVVQCWLVFKHTAHTRTSTEGENTTKVRTVCPVFDAKSQMCAHVHRWHSGLMPWHSGVRVCVFACLCMQTNLLQVPVFIHNFSLLQGKYISPKWQSYQCQKRHKNDMRTSESRFYL